MQFYFCERYKICVLYGSLSDFDFAFHNFKKKLFVMEATTLKYVYPYKF